MFYEFNWLVKVKVSHIYASYPCISAVDIRTSYLLIELTAERSPIFYSYKKILVLLGLGEVQRKTKELKL